MIIRVPAAANPQINDGLRVRLRWDAQQRRYVLGEKFKRRRHNDAEHGEKHDRRADGVARQIAPPFADVMADDYGYTHREARNHERHHLHKGARRADRRDARCVAEAPDDQQVDRSVGRLQNERAEHGQREHHQRICDRPLSKRFFLCHIFVRHNDVSLASKNFPRASAAANFERSAHPSRNSTLYTIRAILRESFLDVNIQCKYHSLRHN